MKVTDDFREVQRIYKKIAIALEGEEIHLVVPAVANVLHFLLCDCNDGCVAQRISTSFLVLGKYHPELIDAFNKALVDSTITDFEPYVSVDPEEESDDVIPFPDGGTRH